MREVFCHQDSARVGLYQSILQEAGIPSFIRNGHTNNTVSPTPNFYPALCVVNDDQYAAALELLQNVEEPEPARLPEWVCPGCQEEVPGNFDACWNCGTPSVGETQADPRISD